MVGARTGRSLGDDPYGTTLARQALRVVLVGAGLAVTGAAVRLVAQALAFAADGDALGPILWLVVQTTWGAAAVVQALLGVVLGLSALMAWRWSRPAERLGEAPFVYPAIGLLFVPAFMGHAAADAFLAVGVVVDALHVAGASVWCGGVAMLAGVARQPEGRARLARLVPAFHGDAVAAVTAVLVSGAIAAWRRLPDPWHPLATSYGVVLVVKVALVVPVLGLGWWSWTRGARASDASPPTVPRIGGGLVAEGGLMLLVLVASAVLAGTPPDP